MSPAGGCRDGEADRYSFSYRPDESNQPTAAIVEAVSWVRGVDSVELEPLAAAVDPDALNALFGRPSVRKSFVRSASGPAPDDLRVVFEYAGYLVTVNADRITVRSA